MRYRDVLIKSAMVTKKASTPAGEQPIPEDNMFDPDEVLNKELTKHYAKLLAAAMKRAGAPDKFIRQADQFVSPTYSYALGRAVHIHPDLLSRLLPKDQAQLDGWNFHSRNVTPGLIRDVVKAYDYSGRKYVPLNQADTWAKGPRMALKEK